MQIVERVEGAENTERLLDRLTSAMARFQEQLDRVYRQQRERDDARRLRNDQVFTVFILVSLTYECSRFLSAVCVCRFF